MPPSTPKPQRKRRLLSRLALLAATTLVSLVAAETLFRTMKKAPYQPPKILKPDGTECPLGEIIAVVAKSGEAAAQLPPGPRSRIKSNLHLKHWYDRPQWDYFAADGCVDVATNSLGFRDLEFTAEKPDGQFRILTIGDSFTFGSGVRLEDSWPQQLERRLAEARGTSVEVINGGYATGFHWPPGYFEWLETDGVALAPDLVILGFCLNDMHKDIPMLSHPTVEPEPWLGGVSQLLYYFQTELERRRVNEERLVAARNGRRVDYKDFITAYPEPWEETKRAMLEMRDTLVARKIPFLVAVFPMVSELGEVYPFLGLHELVEQFCKKSEIEHLDLLPVFRNKNDTELWVHPTDQHPNHIGNRMISDGIFAHLNK